MRSTIRGYALVFSVLVALAAPAFASSAGDDSNDTFLQRLVNIIVTAYDESKIVVPVG